VKRDYNNLITGSLIGWTGLCKVRDVTRLGAMHLTDRAEEEKIVTKHTALKIDTLGNVTKIEFESGKSYDMLKSGVDGWIECVQLKDGIDMWCNEEGKIIGLDANRSATYLFWEVYGVGTDVIAGNVVLTSSNEDGDTVGLTDKQLDSLRPFFGVSTSHPFPMAILNGGE